MLQRGLCPCKAGEYELLFTPISVLAVVISRRVLLAENNVGCMESDTVHFLSCFLVTSC